MFDIKIPKIKLKEIKSPSLRGSLPRKRDLARATNISNKPIREPIPAKLRRAVLSRAKNKCQYPKCSIKEKGNIKLQIHHKNMVSDDNRSSNLMALCATHHQVMHRKYKRVVKRDLTGRRISSKVVKKKTADKIKKQRKQNPFGFNLDLTGLPN